MKEKNTVSRETQADNQRFTMEDALNIQKKDIETWEKVLNEETIKRLKHYAEARNRETKYPMGVFRGQDIERWLTYQRYSIM